MGMENNIYVYLVLFMNLFLDGAFLCLIVTCCMHGIVMHRGAMLVLIVTPPMHGIVGPYPGLCFK